MLIIFAVSILISCGKDVPCQPASAILSFVSFSGIETDSVIIRQYQKNSNFNSLIDSAVFTTSNSTYDKSNDTVRIHFLNGGDYSLRSTFDYEVDMPSANKLYQITNIIEDTTEMRAVPYFKRICVNPIISYTINGQVISGNPRYFIFYIQK